MSHFDQAPLEKESAANPHASGAQSGGFFSKMTSFGGSSFSANASAAVMSQKELERKEKELQALELALNQKEEELMRQEQSAGVEHKNFPPFFPLVHHDIKNDIPDDRKSIQRAAFWSWMGIMLCLAVNLIGAIASWVAGTFDFMSGIGNFFLALIYLLLGVPLSYVLWYKPLYTAMKTTYAGVSYTMFFISYAVHIGFCIFATIAPPFLWKGYSFTGFMSGLSILVNGWVAVGIIYLIGAGLFCVESCLSVYVIGRVYARFRGRPVA